MANCSLQGYAFGYDRIRYVVPTIPPSPVILQRQWQAHLSHCLSVLSEEFCLPWVLRKGLKPYKKHQEAKIHN